MSRGEAENEKVLRFGGSAIASKTVGRMKQDGERDERTDLLTETRVLLEGVVSDKVAMKLPSAKLASDAGTTN